MSCLRRGRWFTSIRDRSSNINLSLQLQPIRFAHKNYYDALGLSPKATNADIKKAYYKLSLKYHPDMTPGEGERFREINAAYEVLGNQKLKRLYDRGALFGHNVPPPEPSPDGHQTKATTFDVRDRTRSPSTGRTQEFNYDDWSKAHYGRVFHDEQVRKEKVRLYKAGNKTFDDADGIYNAIWSFIIVGAVVIVAIGIMSATTVSYDKPSKPKGNR